MSNEHNNAPAPAPAQEVTTPYHRDIWGISHAMADLYYDDWVLLVRAYQTLDASIARMKEQATAQAVPQGWRITKLDGADAYVINGSFGGCVAVKDADIARVIPEAILYELAAALAATPAPVPAQGEPFGYFRAEPFGWTDCAKDDEGAIALYERPQEVGLTNHQFDLICQALALPTADHLPDAGKMVVDHFPDATKMIETAAPVGERDAFERTMMDKYGWQRNDFKLDDFGYADGQTDTAWMAWQTRAALSAGDAVDAQRLDFIEKSARCDPKMDGQHVWWPTSLNKALKGPTLRAAIDAAMRKDKL